jgi:GntR family transcriptional regulator
MICAVSESFLAKTIICAPAFVRKSNCCAGSGISGQGKGYCKVFSPFSAPAAEILDRAGNTCHIIRVTPFRLSLQPGRSIFDQVVFAAKKAFIGGEFRAGQAFPSVRALAADLKIHPNTAHKVVQHLIQERYLEVRPGIGTVVADLPVARAGDRKRLLQQEVVQLVVEAMRVGLDLPDVVTAIESEWAKLGKSREVVRK